MTHFGTIKTREMKGRAKDDFSKWLNEKKSATFDVNGVTFNFSNHESFEQLPAVMRYGVVMDWFFSIGGKVGELGKSPIYFIPAKDSYMWITVYEEPFEDRAAIFIDKFSQMYNTINK